jgi:hypothetical protein
LVVSVGIDFDARDRMDGEERTTPSESVLFVALTGHEMFALDAQFHKITYR